MNLTTTKDYYKTRYKQRKEKGLCPRCGKKKPPDGFSCCPECRADSNTWSKSYYQKNLAKGICVKCRTPLESTAYRLCDTCRVAMMEQARENRKKLRKMRSENHLCVACGAPLSDTTKYKQCFACRLKNNRAYYARKFKKKGQHNAY